MEDVQEHCPPAGGIEAQALQRVPPCDGAAPCKLGVESWLPRAVCNTTASRWGLRSRMWWVLSCNLRRVSTPCGSKNMYVRRHAIGRPNFVGLKTTWSPEFSCVASHVRRQCRTPVCTQGTHHAARCTRSSSPRVSMASSGRRANPDEGQQNSKAGI